MRRFWLVLWWASCGFHAEELNPEDTDDEAALRRRLKEWERQIKVNDHLPELLDERRLTPLPEISGLELRHVVTVNKANPRHVGHARFTPEYHERRRLREGTSAESVVKRFARGRRLSAIQSDLIKSVAQTPFEFFTPRDRVRVFTVLNGAALPEEAYTNASINYWAAGGLVHQNPNEKMLYTKTTDQITAMGDPSLLDSGGFTPGDMGGNFSGNMESVANAYRDGLSLRDASQTVETEAKKQKWTDNFLGQRTGFNCTQRQAEEPRCWSDPGVALSVYEDAARNMILVFHNDWSANWYEYIKWQNRAWIIDESESQVKNQWTIDARQSVTPEMQSRGGETYDENQERCAFKDEVNLPFANVEAFSARTDISVDILNSEGYWQLVKTIVRLILPETRDRVTEKLYSIYLTGSGFGGAWASLASMWLKKIDDATYDSYNIAGAGFQCLARKLTIDMSPWAEHPQVKVYAHVMDIYARMDYVSGYTCLYGGPNMTEGTDIHRFCGMIIGLSGPQLFYRGEPFGKYLDPGIRDKVQAGRAAFDACHYYTHSAWYAAMLFVSDKVLLADGTTDGGCKTIEGIPQKDELGRCPTASRVDSDCTAIEDTSQDLPVKAMAAVAGGLATFIICLACTGYCCLQRMRNDMWVFGHDKRSAERNSEGCWQKFLSCFGLGGEHKKKQKKKRATGGRAKAARDRAKEARINRAAASSGGRKKQKAKDGNNGEEEWEALKDKLEMGFDAERIGKADDALSKAAAMMENRSATMGVDGYEQNPDMTGFYVAEEGLSLKGSEKKEDGKHKKEKDKKDKDKDKKAKKTNSEAGTKDGAKPKRTSVRKTPGRSNSERPPEEKGEPKEKKKPKKHASSPAEAPAEPPV